MTERDIFILAGLLVFGIAYNRLIAYMEKRPDGHNGFTAFLVAVGVAVTVAARIPRWGIDMALDLLLAFVFSGTPMILGSVLRYIARRDHESKRVRELTEELLERMNG